MNHMICRVTLIATAIGLAASGCNTGGPTLAAPKQDILGDSIRAALNGSPDENTVAAMRAIDEALNPQEKQYLSHLDWSKVRYHSALTDPIIARALHAISVDIAKSRTQDYTPGQRSSLASSTRQIASPLVDADLYSQAVAVMLECYGDVVCNGPACPAAVLAAHCTVYGLLGEPETPSSHLTYADKGTWSCVTEYFAGVVDSSCQLRGFCRSETISFPSQGQACDPPSCYSCADENWSRGPNPQKCLPPPPKPKHNGNSGANGECPSPANLENCLQTSCIGYNESCAGGYGDIASCYCKAACSIGCCGSPSCCGESDTYEQDNLSAASALGTTCSY